MSQAFMQLAMLLAVFFGGGAECESKIDGSAPIGDFAGGAYPRAICRGQDWAAAEYNGGNVRVSIYDIDNIVSDTFILTPTNKAHSRYSVKAETPRALVQRVDDSKTYKVQAFDVAKKAIVYIKDGKTRYYTFTRSQYDMDLESGIGGTGTLTGAEDFGRRGLPDDVLAQVTK